MDHLRIIDSPQSINLQDYDPDDTGKLTKRDALKELEKLEEQLAQTQEMLYAAAQRSILIILQGMDTAGKDGTIEHVMSHINTTGCHVWSFKVPTAEELAHDFLWRVHQRTPARGMMAIFNRSHYEDVLVARVHQLVPHTVWQQRFEQINHFESLLVSSGTIVFKFFLHISKDEQRSRLMEREDDTEKAWKLSVADWQERQYWKDYQEAYTDVLSRCGTHDAPWYIVPANKKWYRNYVIAQALVRRLAPHVAEWHTALEARGKTELEALRAYRAEHGTNGAMPKPEEQTDDSNDPVLKGRDA